MKATEFKNLLTRTKDHLRNKTLVITMLANNKDVTIKFNSLREFGKEVLRLESEGFGFGFWSVKNDLIGQAVNNEKEFFKLLNIGVWNEITFFATDVKI